MAEASAPPQDNGQTATTSTTGEFGASDFGARLDYSQPEYKDLWAMILFWVHVALVLVLTVVFWIGISNDIAEATDGLTPSPTFASSTTEESDDSNITGVFVALLCGVIAGALFGVLWLQCMKIYAEQIIKIILGVSAGIWLVLAIFGLTIQDDPDTLEEENGMGIVVIGIIMFLIMCLYAKCVWHRIPFASACLSIASMIVQNYPGTVYTALLTVFIMWVWYIVWVFMVVGYLVSAEAASGAVILLMFLSLFWGINTFANVSHTTTCGVAATWYFNSGKLEGPVSKAYKRTMTTSFGSVAFGSLLVALLQLLKMMIKSSKGYNPCAHCLVACIERAMRYFNKYAFVQVATYGSTYWEAAKATWDLFTSAGIYALVNDDLTGMAIVCGAFLGMIVAAVVGYILAQAFYPGEPGYAFLIAYICCTMGYKVVGIILSTVVSGVTTIFVCYSEDPAALSANRPDAFQQLTEANETMASVASNRGVVVSVTVQPQQQGQATTQPQQTA